MGIFDFFKKKETTTNPAKNHESKDPDTDIQKAKSSATENSLQAQNTESDNSGIEVIQDDQGSHGDNFGALLGFGYMNSPDGRQLVNEMVALSAIQPAIHETRDYSISETDFRETNGTSKLVKMRTLKANDELVSAFPYLQTKYVLPFETKQIIEWEHVSNLEAEIKGGGRDTFGLAFFATDYAAKRDKYKSTKKLNIHISAIGLVLDESDLTEINGQEVSPDFATYMPSTDLSRPTYYDFIGTLNSFQECRLTNENTGFLLNVKLINQEGEPDFFTIDMFINRENMRITDLRKGMKVAGALWLQGEIA